jgi:hypothetical protein
MTPIQKEAVEQIKALRKLTTETGTRTTRSQNQILQSLSDADLTLVALELQRQQ